MHIQLVEIANFRKLKAVRIDFAENTTVFVGANNSGKTSAMVALRHFLVNKTDFSINDFTLTHWATINAAAAAWEKPQTSTDAEDGIDWNSLLPHLDIWLNVATSELHFVQKILPTLDWAGEYIGVRLRYEPKDLQTLKAEYLAARESATTVINASKTTHTSATAEQEAKIKKEFTLWPESMMDFLSRRLRGTFEVRAYLLDPSKLVPPKEGIAFPQVIPSDSFPLESDPFKGLIRIDEISAQRGFGLKSSSLQATDEENESEARSGKKLSNQLRTYYTQHLDLSDRPESKDVDALRALHEAQTVFDEKLKACFADAFKELENIGYPGMTDPKLTVVANFKPIDGLNHASAVQYEVPTQLAANGCSHRLPEDSNGLGYQNLVSIVFALMAFRDKWMKVGKAAKPNKEESSVIPPLHLVLIEEPEAHLHAQVQQVFIKQAYDVLRKHDRLGESKELRTQLVVSTHSSHIAHEADFASLRYFRRLPITHNKGSIPISSVVNLCEIFGSETKTEKFVKRYLKATHCDLFFADGAILIEGPAERILVPHFVRTHKEYEQLKRCYISWLEIGGSHAHRLKPLITHLGLTTLIITDIDAKNAAGNSVSPARGLALKARNETLKSWVPGQDSLDLLLDKNPDDLVSTDCSGYAIRVAYQQPVQVKYKSDKMREALANTFEDALVYENIEFVEKLTGAGLLTKLQKALKEAANLADLADKFRNALSGGGKAEFAMELLYAEEIDSINVPKYIKNGLIWLADQLSRKEMDITGKALNHVHQASSTPTTTTTTATDTKKAEATA